MLGIKYCYFNDFKSPTTRKELFIELFRKPNKFLQDAFLFGLFDIDQGYRLQMVKALDAHVNLDSDVLTLVRKTYELV